MINHNTKLPIDLYHGTSTLFLDSIIKNGLGGINPAIEWKVLELTQEVYKLSELHLKETHLFQVSSNSFKQMAKQSNNGFNFQHGDTYLSPARSTAARYAMSKRYGSELLTYTIDFLKELISLDIHYVKNNLYKKYPKVFGLIEANPSPLIIQVKNLSASSLLNEYGESATENLKEINELMNETSSMRDRMLQQTNFRLTTPVGADNLKFFLVNVQNWDPYGPKYNMYELKPESINN